jgi:hypothetical protein
VRGLRALVPLTGAPSIEELSSACAAVDGVVGSATPFAARAVLKGGSCCCLSPLSPNVAARLHKPLVVAGGRCCWCLAREAWPILRHDEVSEPRYDSRHSVLRGLKLICVVVDK